MPILPRVLIDGLRSRRIYLRALLIFAASRLVVVIGLNFGKLLVPMENPEKWDAGPAWYHRLLRWDAGWYASIVNNGYHEGGAPTAHGSTAFYPLYPLVSFALKSLLGIDSYLALLLVANLSSVVAVFVMTKFFADEMGDKTALLSIAFFFFFPSTLFLSAGYTESLCLVFILLSLSLLMREKFVLAAIAAGIALGARVTGIVMIPVILWEMWRCERLPHRLPRMAVCGALATSGLLVYMVYLGIRFRHPLAFVDAQQAWHDRTFLDRLISAVTLGPFWHFNWRNGGGFLFFLTLTIWSFRCLRFPIPLYALGSLMLPYLTVGITDSMNRFIVMCFPAFMYLGIICKERLWLAGALIGIFAALLLVNTALFSQWYWVG
jgi:hypothetical protein